MIRTHLWSGLAAAAVAIALFIPGTAQAQATRRVQVNINSMPQGAAVRLDNESSNPIGTTPLRLFRIPSGAHTLYFTRDGYLNGQLQITVGRRGESFTATLTQGGSIYVSADIDGAQIFVDGNPTGTTPGRVNNLQPGQHAVEIRQAGMQTFREMVTVGAGAVASVNASLRPPPPTAAPTGTVRVIVSNPNGAVPGDVAVSFDGAPMTGAPPAVENAQPGQHIVQISANGFRTVRREVTVTAGQAVALAVDLEAIAVVPTGGSVRVLTPTAGAQVFLDGELLTGSPAVRENVPPGTHAIRVTAPGHSPVSREITVTLGQATNVDVGELPVVAQVNRLTVRTTTPNATVFIDGRNVGPSPYNRDDMPAADYNVTLRAQGFEDRNEHCTVSLQAVCDINVTLNRSVGRGAIHVELTHPVATRAVVLLDGNEIGEVGAGRDIPNITAENHEIRVRADRYAEYVEAITLQDGENHRTMVNLRRSHTGPTGAELSSRRSAISTWGGSPLSRGDAAVDIWGAYGPYPFAVRGTIGLVDYGTGGADVGFSVRSMGYVSELELRFRGGLHLLDGLVNVGGEFAAFAGLGFSGQSNAGVSAYALASIHTLAPTSDESADVEDPGARSDHFGSFALTLRLGFEASSDGLRSMIYRNATDTQPGGRFDACDPVGIPAAGSSMPSAMGGPCNISTQRDPMGNLTVANGSQQLVRGVAGAIIEFGLSRHANLFLGLDHVFIDPMQRSSQRVYYQAMWGGNDSGNYVRFGITYKF